MINDTILKIDSLKKSFSSSGSRDENLAVISGLNLELRRGNVTALVGGNGTGKTTLFNMVSGFIKPDSGTIAFFSNNSWKRIDTFSPYQIARAGVGRMFQDNHIFPNMTVVENLLISDHNDFGEKPYQPLFFHFRNKRVENERRTRTISILEDLFGPGNPFIASKDKPAHSLSYGQQRLLGLARLLLGDYSLLLLDEPTSGVSPANIDKIRELIGVMVSRKEMTVLLIEHNWKFVLDVAKFCYFMSKGNIELSGTPDDILGNPDVRKTYLGV